MAVLGRQRKPAPSLLSGRKIAVLIGINDYQHGVPTLRSAVQDVHDVADVLRDSHGYTTRLVLDAQATLARLRQLLADLQGELQSADRFVLYFAGHGLAEEMGAVGDGPQGYLIPQDAKRDEVESFLPMAEVQKQLERLQCRHLLLILDCCFAGAFRWSSTRSVMPRPAMLYRERYERYLSDPAWQVITSAACDERALDVVAGKVLGSRGDDQKNSPFAAALCRGLHGEADLRAGGQPGDGVIVANELHLYIENEFAITEVTTGQRQQKPLLWSIGKRDKGQYIFDWDREPSLPSALELSEKNNPYRGLQMYREEDAKLFFGRDTIAADLLRIVSGSKLVVVTGASGTGKSSLVRAGLVPRLKKASNDWHILSPKRPGTDALAVYRDWACELKNGQERLAPALTQWRQEHAQDQLLLIIDQLEELITLGSKLEPFLEELAEVLREGGVQVHVVMTLRSDFEPHFQKLLSSQQLGAVRFLIAPIRRPELREVIEKPASERVLYFEPPELVDKLLDEVVDTPAPLPLLSFVLSEMYRAALRRPLERMLSEADYQSLGGVSGALSKRADALYDRHTQESEQASFRYLMLRMVVPGELARRRVLEDELKFSDPEEQQRVDAIQKKLLDERLLVSDLDSQGKRFIEPAHDKLVMGWPRLHQFMTSDPVFVLHHSVIVARQSRDAGGQLWSFDARRAQATKALRDTPRRWNRGEQDFIRKSQRLYHATWGTGAALVLSVLLALGIWLQRERNNSAQLRQDKEDIQKRQDEIQKRTEETRQRLLATYVERGRQLLLNDHSPTEALPWLHRAQQSGSTDPLLPSLLAEALHAAGAPIAVLAGHGGSVLSASFSLDGRRIVTACEDGTARIWNAESGSLLAVLKDHTGRILGANFSPDGSRIVTASADKTARLWDVQSGRCLATLPGHTDHILAASFSPDGRRVVTVSRDKLARIWDEKTAKLLVELRGHTEAVLSAGFSPDGRRIVTASADKTARLWDVQSGRCLATLAGHTDHILAASFSPDGRCIVTASRDQLARIWDEKTAKLLVELRGHTEAVLSAGFSPDGRRIVTASGDKTARIWDAETGRRLLDLQGHTDYVLGASFSPDGRRILTASREPVARVWDAESGRILAYLKGHTGWLQGASFSPDGHRIVTASEDQTARIWKADTGRLLVSLRGHTDHVLGASFSADGHIVVTASLDQTARVWDSDSGRQRATLKGQSASISPDGRRIITASLDNTARLWDAETGAWLADLQGHTEPVFGASFSPDSRLIVTASDDGTARVWNAESMREIVALKGHTNHVLHASFSPDGRYIVTASDDHSARVWDAMSGKLRASLQGNTESVLTASFSKDGRRILTASLGPLVRVWDAESGGLLVNLQGHRCIINSASFSSDGSHAVTASDDHSARLWDVQKGLLISDLQGHTDSVWSASFSRDGSRVATASDDHTACVWDAKTGRLLARLEGHTGRVNSGSFSTDGSRIITASDDHTARIWDLSKETRDAKEIAKLMGCYWPLRFDRDDNDVLVASKADPDSCQTGVEAPPPRGAAAAKQAVPPKPVRPPRRQNAELPACDKVEVFAWEGSGFRSLTPAKPIRLLQQKEAEEVAALWRALRTDCNPAEMALCHKPVYGIRFYPQGAPPTELSLCWSCRNYYFIDAGTMKPGCSFDTSTKEAKSLLARFKELLPDAASRRPADRSNLDLVRESVGEVRGSLGKDLIRSVIHRHMNEVKSCYKRQLAHDRVVEARYGELTGKATPNPKPGLPGRVIVEFTIDPTGAVPVSDVLASTVGSPPVEQCIAEAVRRWEFPKPQGGIVIVTWPFVLQGK